MLVSFHATFIEKFIEGVCLVFDTVTMLTVEQTEEHKIVSIDLIRTLSFNWVFEGV